MVRLKNLSLITISLMLLLTSCKEDTIPPELFGNISGIVLDADVNLPITGASVTTSPATNAIVTDSSGKFKYLNIAVGSYTITVSKNNYDKNAVSVQVNDGETTSPIILLNKSTSNNNPPDKPTNPIPEENATDQPVSLNFAWTANDTDSKDTLWFDVYLYESNDPVKTKIASDITDTTILIENLKYNTTYYWQVTAKDGEASTNSNTWSFTTMAAPDTPFLFATRKDGNYEIYSSDTTGNITFRLTYTSNRDWYPRLSPNKSKIAFISDEQVDPQIFTMNTDGSDIFRVTNIPVAGYHNNGIGFSWSPNGGQLIYPNYDKLYKINQSGASLTQIATAPPDRHFRETDWSASTNKIVALTIGEKPYDSEIYLMDSDGSNMTLFYSNLPGCMEYPTFSIDGNSIMFTRDVSGFESQDGRQLDSHIFIVSINGSDTTDVSINKPAGTNDLQPRFSPDGANIIFINTSNVLGSTAYIWVMTVNGNDRWKIINNAIMPDWN
ncbi:carboxypeptidase-like regulatory domain-containing protein [bacterium BMS3Abin03]|nr:carboxypeptidase-like regulatory domain-containing protein [bacterium BMS3Abin03]